MPYDERASAPMNADPAQVRAKRVCLNMIVKNERANLERCLAAIVDHIDCWVIGDTGSTDGTSDFIRSFFAARDKPGEIHEFPFHNFEQARNAALDCAARSPLPYDYLLLCDADMELIVEDKFFGTRLDAPGYRLVQKTDSGLTYWNTRLVARNIGARYHGVTHEYLDVPGGVKELEGVWYKDHATGSNRVDKFERDVKLLLGGLEKEPDNRRYWFYLAQSLKDAGRTKEAIETYAKRADMGGWDEEAWYARLQQARCLRTAGDDAGFIRTALAAFNQRPQRAEPLYDLARHFRERGMNEASVLFAEAGLSISRPKDDILFIEDFVYQTGLEEEFSIAANYSRDAAQKERGRLACNWLALDRSVPQRARDLARSNLEFYAESARELMSSFEGAVMTFPAPEGYTLTNPSVARHGEDIVVLMRTVNYYLTADNRYETRDGAQITTRNFLLNLDDSLKVKGSAEILAPADLPKPAYELVIGFEDMRLFEWRGALWTSSCVRELTPEGWCEQVLARIDCIDGKARLNDWRVLRPEGPRLHEKNWMPRVERGSLSFIYSSDPVRIVDAEARTVVQTEAPIAADQFRGGSQALAFDGGWLALVHEAREARGTRFYWHRFIWLDQDGRLKRVSKQFFFEKKGIEFAAGLAWHPDGKRLLVSYGVGDHEAWLATVDVQDVREILLDAAWFPSARSLVGDSNPPVAGESKDLGARTCSGGRDFPGRGEARAWPHPDPPPLASRATDDRPSRKGRVPETTKSAEDAFDQLAPFLGSVDSPAERRERSRAFDARMNVLLDEGGPLPQIHCFYEVLSKTAQHHSLIAATSSMRAAGHRVRVWTYSPEKLDFLKPHGIEIARADEVVPRDLFNRVVAGSEIRYFSDLFRYAALYEHGGLWMDTDVVLLRPFPFKGDYFFNLQWRGSHKGHYLCGNVIHARRHSRHMRALYEAAVESFFAAKGKTFGDIGPKLLSDYVASEAGAELRDWVFSPMFFNTIDWTETDAFNKPLGELGDFLNDGRVFGVHLWNARTHVHTREDDKSLIAMLSNPQMHLPSLSTLADKFDTDKNRHTGNRHFYSRIYDQLLAPRRFSVRRLMEIGLCRGLAEKNQTKTPSVDLWQTYFPYCQVIGVDLTDFSALNNPRFRSFICDQSKEDQLRSVAAKLEPGSIDVIIDDGSHASFDEQLTLREFFPLLAEGGWYFMEDLDWQPPGEDSAKITLMKTLLREIKEHGRANSIDPFNIAELAGQFENILFFDSHYELNRAKLMGGLVAIQKRRGGGIK